MRITGNITDISIDYQTGKPRLTLVINEKQIFNDGIDKIKDLPKLDIELKKHRNKRSLDANAYYHCLLNQLVEALQIGREELHFRLLKDYSPLMLVPLLPNQDPKGFFKYYEKFKKTIIEGKEAIYYKVYKPSSEMDSKEFWVLLKGIESECREQGIPTIEEKELERLIESGVYHELWNN